MKIKVLIKMLKMEGSDLDMNINKIKMNKIKKLNLPTLSIIAFVISFAILIQIAYIDSAHALTKYINCVTKIANNQGTLSLSDVTACYDKQFKGAINSDDDGFPLN
jgi:hypothetical protein